MITLKLTSAFVVTAATVGLLLAVLAPEFTADLALVAAVVFG